MNARRALRTAALALPLATLAARADGVTLSYAASIYTDAKDVALKSPEGVACTESSFVVADTGNRRLLTYSLRDGIIGPTGEVKLAQLPSPVRVQVDGKGNVLVLDGKSHRIVRVDAKGGFGGVLAFKGGPAAPVVASFKLDSADGIYALDIASGKVLVADASGAVSRELELPRGTTFTDIAVDGGGTIYGVDGVNASVWSAERGGTAFRQLGKSLRDRMSFAGYVLAHQGKLYIVDQNGMGIVVLGGDGSYLGRQLSIGWADGFVYYPAQLCINEKGEALLADRANNRVQLFTMVQ
jgi:hypothetical protein